MEPLISKHELRSILESGLCSGKWSTLQFNKGILDPVMPSREFLEKHPAFLDMAFRDLEAYHNLNHQSAF
jgi:hypothetical protein